MLTDLDKRFNDPPRSFSPVPIWWWSGEKLDAQRLRWQLERFAEGGVYNLLIMNLAPSGPLYGSDLDDPPFFSGEWWTMFRGVCEDARVLGMHLWFYDQFDFSGANMQARLVTHHPTFAGQSLERITCDVEGTGMLECPEVGTPLAASVIPIDGQGQPVGEPSPVPVQGRSVTWQGSGTHRLMLFYSIESGFDYFNVSACQTLLAMVHGAYEAHIGDFFGTVIVGTFQDELAAMPTWSRDFAVSFRVRCGYDLLAHLPALWEEYGEQAQRVRHDYHATRAALAETALFKPLFQWHEERRVLCGFDQQHPARAGYPIQSVQLYADYPRTHRWYSAPGSDHHGEAKIHSSLAHLYDRSRVWIESFHSSGWGGTLEETFDWLLPWIRVGASGCLLVDALIESDGSRIALMTDESWQVARNGRPTALSVQRKPWLDMNSPRVQWLTLNSLQVWRRPHPLPATNWLEDAPPDGTVLALVSDAHAEHGRIEWLRFVVPSGAVRMHLRLHGAATVYLDGVEQQAVTHSNGTDVTVMEVALSHPTALRRVCALRIATKPGYRAGGILDGPVRFEMATGVMKLGSWEEQGFVGYSGGVRYRQTLVRDNPDRAGVHTLLDLGRVRGTAEIHVNGEAVGVRIWSPYVFDLTDHLRSGENDLRVSVYNTLGPYMESISPTSFVLPGQTVSGLLGPVTLIETGGD